MNQINHLTILPKLMLGYSMHALESMRSLLSMLRHALAVTPSRSAERKMASAAQRAHLCNVLHHLWQCAIGHHHHGTLHTSCDRQLIGEAKTGGDHWKKFILK